MNNFIELTNFENDNVALVNLSSIFLIKAGKEGGTELFLSNSSDDLSLGFCIHVRESYELVHQKIFANQKASSIGKIVFDLEERVKCVICDQICKFPSLCENQDDLDEKCENCILSEVLG